MADGVKRFTPPQYTKNRMSKRIRPMRVEMPEKWENSRVHPGMSIGESIFQSVVGDVIARKEHAKKVDWLEKHEQQIENEIDDIIYNQQ